jgi:hypothetical protein
MEALNASLTIALRAFVNGTHILLIELIESYSMIEQLNTTNDSTAYRKSRSD